MNNLTLISDQKTLFLDSNINQDIKKLSRSKSENSPKYQNKKGGLMRRNSSNDNILGINSYFDKEIPPPPPYDVHSNSNNPNSTTITTTTTTTTVTTVTTTMISNSGDSTSKQQLDTNSSSNIETPNITVVSYESSCDTNNNETKIPENSNFAMNDDIKLRRSRSGSAPSVPIISFKGQDDNKYKSNTIPSAKSMVNLLNSGRNTVLLNKSYKESPKQYLDKLRDTLSKSELATLLTKSKDVFHETVLRTYMETFDFTSDPIDIALR